MHSTDIILDKMTVVRISHLINIYTNLILLLPSKDAANTWIKHANTAPLFAGETALN